MGQPNNTTKLIITIAACELAGIIGSLFTTPSIPSWYASIIKPDFNPPSWVFAPVWTTLFALMGIAAFLVWKKDIEIKKKRIALSVFFGQLILNILWSALFFGLHSPGAAFVEIIFLWLAILATIILFSSISRAAGWLLAPYIIWVSFAGFLNYSIYDLNKNGPVACITDVKICDDGSYVTRQAPTCEFATCPNKIETKLPTNMTDTSLWSETRDEAGGITFLYPTTLGTKYVSTSEWPPKLEIINQPFSCSEQGQEVAMGGQTKNISINNRAYCLIKASEGAAGSIYTTYTYTLPLGNMTMSLSFILRAVQCGNYDEPQKSECETEQATFSTDDMADKMIRSVSEE